MRTWYDRIPPLLPLLFTICLTASLFAVRADAQVFKWIDQNEVAHYTSNRASIPIKYQDTVKIVETESRSDLFRTREVTLPQAGPPDLHEEYLPPEPAFTPRKPGTDVVGDVLETPGTAASPANEATAQPPPARQRRTTRLGLKAYTGKSEGWWRSRFSQADALVDKQQRIVDAHRKKLRKIIKSHASGNEVIPLEDDPEFQKMARVLPREEGRLNKVKRQQRRLGARAEELRIPGSWRH